MGSMVVAFYHLPFHPAKVPDTHCGRKQVNANPSISLYHTTSRDDPINPVDFAVKRAVVAGAMAVVLGHEHPNSLPYEPIEVPQYGDVWHTLSEAFREEVGSAKELTSTMFRRMMQESGAATPLIADEVQWHSNPYPLVYKSCSSHAAILPDASPLIDTQGETLSGDACSHTQYPCSSAEVSVLPSL